MSPFAGRLTLLSRAVAAWRSTGRFDPTYLGDPPREVQGLAASFAAAVATLAEQERGCACRSSSRNY